MLLKLLKTVGTDALYMLVWPYKVLAKVGVTGWVKWVLAVPLLLAWWGALGLASLGYACGVMLVMFAGE
jgi:hypothetical protein